MVRLLNESAVLSQDDPTPSLLCEAPLASPSAAAALAAWTRPPWRGEPGLERLTLPHSLKARWCCSCAASGSRGAASPSNTGLLRHANAGAGNLSTASLQACRRGHARGVVSSGGELIAWARETVCECTPLHVRLITRCCHSICIQG